MTSSPPPPPTINVSKSLATQVWQPGDLILDTCEVKEVFTGGALAYVYRVHHKEWGIDLAVKSPKFSGDELPPGNVDYYVREAETWVKLGLHPQIVCCYFIRVIEGVPRIFMEFVDGCSLQEAVEDGRLYAGNPREALRRMIDIAVQSSWGLNYAHKNGLIHQDVKPANVLLASDGTAKVTDFGMAQAASGLIAASQRSPAGGVQFGSGEGGSILVDNSGMTPAYCSPEQAAGSPLTRRSDLWSWALAMLEMFTGGLTWEKGPDAPLALEEALRRGPPKAEIPPIPRALAGLLRKCFAEKPEARPHDMEVVSTALQEIYAGEFGISYPRSETHIETLLADTINNRAVSMVDLGKHQEALQLLDEAVKAETTHTAALFNRGLHLWRSARLTDEELLESLEENQKNLIDRRETAYLLGLIHLERGDLAEAEASIRKARDRYGQLTAFSRISTATRRMEKSAHRCLWNIRINDSGVSTSAISSDGSLILAGGNDGVVRLLDSVSGQVVHALEGHQGRVQSVSLAPDGRFGLSGGWDGELRLWDLEKGNCLRLFQGHEDLIQGVAFTLDTRSALSASTDTTLRCWDLETGECRRVFQGHLDTVSAVLPLPNGRFAVTASYDNTLRVWDLITGLCAAVIPWYRGCGSNLALVQGGRRLLLASGDQIWLADLAMGQAVQNYTGHRGAVKAVQATQDGRHAVSASLDGTLRLWELATGRCLRTFYGHAGAVNTTAVSSHRPLFVTGGSDGTLQLWQLGKTERAPNITVLPRSSKEIVELSTQVEAQVNAASQIFSQGDYAKALEIIARVRALPGYGQNPKLIDIWDKIGRKGRRCGLRSSWLSQKLKPGAAGANTLAFLPTSQTLLSGDDDRCLRLWDLTAGKSQIELEGHQDRIRSVAVSGVQVAISGSSDGTLRLWDLETGRCQKILIGHANVVNCVALTPDGKVGISGSSDSTIRIWDLERGKCRQTLQGHSHSVRGVALTPDGRLGLSAGWDKTLQVWDLASGDQKTVFTGHNQVIDALALSPDGKTAVTGGLDGTLRLWNLETLSSLPAIENISGYIRAVTFSPDGRFVFTGDQFGSISSWDLESGSCAHTLLSHAGGITSISVSPDGRFLASAGSDGFIMLWRLDWIYGFKS